MSFVLLTVVTACSASSAAGSSVTAGTTDANDLLSERFLAPNSGEFRVTASGRASGSTNLGPLWGLTDTRQPSRIFYEGRARASLVSSRWIRASSGRWWFEYGEGTAEAYSGNGDAGQLWIDLHTGERMRMEYEPVMSGGRTGTSWYSIGRSMPIRALGTSGRLDLSLRLLSGSDYLHRALTGYVRGEGYNGMVRQVSSRTGGAGQGWCVDAAWTFAAGGRWSARIAVDGLLGRMTWHNLSVEEGYIVSPRLFVDRDGFLRDYGGITGAQWREDVSLNVRPLLRMDAVYSGSPILLFGMEQNPDTGTVPSLGMAWEQKRSWLPYVRYYPSQKRIEAGAVGCGWQIRVSGDDWPAASPRYAEAAVSISPVRF